MKNSLAKFVNLKIKLRKVFNLLRKFRLEEKNREKGEMEAQKNLLNKLMKAQKNKQDKGLNRILRHGITMKFKK